MHCNFRNPIFILYSLFFILYSLNAKKHASPAAGIRASFHLFDSFTVQADSLRHLVEHGGELALLVSSVVLVEKVLSYSLVNLLNSYNVSSLSFFLVAGFNSCEELLYAGLELGLEHLVLKSLGSDYFYTLLSGFNVRHCCFSLK